MREQMVRQWSDARQAPVFMSDLVMVLEELVPSAYDQITANIGDLTTLSVVRDGSEA